MNVEQNARGVAPPLSMLERWSHLASESIGVVPVESHAKASTRA